jgi:DNA mismatch repair protein MutS2
MRLDAKTRRDLGWDVLVEALAQRAATGRGAALCREVAPLADAEAARRRAEEIVEVRALDDTGDGLPLGGTRDIDEALARAAKQGVLDLPTLRDVASTLGTAAQVKRHLIALRQRAPRLAGRSAALEELDEVWRPIDESFERGDGAVRLADRASPALGGLRRRAQKVREELERRIEGLLDSAALAPHLQDRFATQREDRYVVPVRVDAKSQVRGIVHGTSQSGQTLFVEPEEVVDLNNRLKLAELEVADEERRILLDLSTRVGEALPAIRDNLVILGELDFLAAAARLSADLKATPAEVGEGGLDLRRARHPLLLLARRQQADAAEVVPNDIVLAEGQTMIVSGPNAGGKTVSLKTAGLCVLLAGAGLHVPAQEGSRVPRVLILLSDVGDDQSLERDLSTFSAHVLHLRECLAAAAPGTLLLLDEIAVGTDPEQGAALAQAFLEAIAARGATAIVTTHYDRLKALAARDRRFVNASVGFDVDRLAPTYQLHLGVPGASGAVVVARRLGLEGAVCDRAVALLGAERTGLEALLLSLEGERQKTAAEREAAARERQSAEELRRRAEATQAEAKERLARARKGAHDEAVEALRKAREELERHKGVLRRRGGEVQPAELIALKRELDQKAAEVFQAAPTPEAPPGRAPRPDELKPGVEVWVQRLGGRATVLTAPRGGKLQVQAGPLRVTVETGEVLIPAAATPKSARQRRGHSAFDEEAPPVQSSASVRGRYPSVDVRGERFDAAQARVEKFLDDALRASQEGILIVHGHGTGALRDGLRRHFTGYPGVAELRPGTPDEGGDGVTVLTLA